MQRSRSTLKVIEYIWLDGIFPTQKLRSKTRIVELSENPNISDLPIWNFDGSSTSQADSDSSDCYLKPVCLIKDSLDDGGDYLLLCEVLNSQRMPHKSNYRSDLLDILSKGGDKLDPWMGFEQEYTMFYRNTPLGWPEHGFPGEQGPYYCGVGSEQIFGRELANLHRKKCVEAGILYYGMNAEVMPGQWEYQIGYRFDGEDASALNICDHLWIARWLMHRLSEKYNIHISHDNKPVKGDWNGAGMHTNFSTKEIRDKSTGNEAIKNAISFLKSNHKKHIRFYGEGLEERLTGKHETSRIDRFSSGNGNRSSSIRIPEHVARRRYGYIEDRRPGANADPYIVASLMISTISGIEFNPNKSD